MFVVFVANILVIIESKFNLPYVIDTVFILLSDENMKPEKESESDVSKPYEFIDCCIFFSKLTIYNFSFCNL